MACPNCEVCQSVGVQGSDCLDDPLPGAEDVCIRALFAFVLSNRETLSEVSGQISELQKNFLDLDEQVAFVERQTLWISKHLPE
jgi:hypothetical protein